MDSFVSASLERKGKERKGEEALEEHDLIREEKNESFCIVYDTNSIMQMLSQAVKLMSVLNIFTKPVRKTFHQICQLVDSISSGERGDLSG